MDHFDSAEDESLSSLRRLRAAGLVEGFGVDGRGKGWVTFSAAYFALLQAGRNPLAEPAFLMVWTSGDADQVRQWVAREAERVVGTEPVTPPEGSS